MTWREAVIEAIERYTKRHDSTIFNRQEFLDEELDAFRELKKTMGRVSAKEINKFQTSTWYQPDDFVFTSEKGYPIDPNRATREVTKIRDRIHRPPGFHLHDLRHTHASLMIESGEHMKVISERLGHSSISTTMDIYGHVSEEAQRAAVGRFSRLLRSDRENTQSEIDGAKMVPFGQNDGQ
jgi:integrase